MRFQLDRGLASCTAFKVQFCHCSVSGMLEDGIGDPHDKDMEVTADEESWDGAPGRLADPSTW